ncbi:LA2681 family HEPN domain-containing protein [Sorangium sp. So ce302]|uniref:LA2681 family HEPN domain-containing protein n=1 Tax=Sorangium sp. So ce302 TaxID=3133297 RepID=UPI003F613BFA
MTNIDTLIDTKSLTDLDLDDAIALLAKLIDGSEDAGRTDGLQNAIRLADDLLRNGTRLNAEPLLHYFVGNAWAGLRYLRRASDPDTEWTWEDQEAREEILALRRAFSHQRFNQLEPIRRCQIATNLGNLMSNVGRFVDALAYYDAARGVDPNFGMEHANRGVCLLHYARALYDDGHQAVFATSVVSILERALSLPLEPGLSPRLRMHHEYASRRAGKSIEDVDRNGAWLAENDPTEKAFQLWALRERLYLNPLNDLGAFSVAARDVLHLPTMSVSAEHGSGFHGFYNQLKQEFAVARWLLYEGLHPGSGRHFADKNLGLLDTWNDTVFGLATERVKLAFRVAYSLLDKVAIFLARYFKIVRPLHKINIRSLWHVNGQPEKGIIPDFENRKNWPLRGLFWLSKDLHEWDQQYHQAIEPDARDVAKLRNQLEHQYARVVAPRIIRRLDEPSAVPQDLFGFVVDKTELEAKALRLLKTARAALIYLSLAIHQEEIQKTESASGGAYRGQFPVFD